METTAFSNFSLVATLEMRGAYNMGWDSFQWRGSITCLSLYALPHITVITNCQLWSASAAMASSIPGSVSVPFLQTSEVNHVSVRFMPVNMSSTKSCWPVARSSKKISLARSSKKISLSLRTRAKTVEGDLLVKEASTTGDSDDIGIMSIHHVGLLCENLERSLDFYQNLLGLKINEARPHEKLPYRGAWLWVGSEMIHLMELPNPDPLTGRPEHGGRDRHACISIRDVSKLKKVLDKAGVPYTLSKSGRPAIFTRDPDANALEFTQVDN